MARIPTYELDQVFDDNDLLLGTDGATSALTTKNFSLAGLAEYVIDKLIDPDATSFCIPVFRDPADTQGANATRITSSIIQQNTYPNGSNISISGTLDAIKKIQIKGNGSVAGQLELNCENNNHGVAIQAPPHSAGASYTMILPVDMGTAGKQLTTDGTSQLYWADPEDDNLDIIADAGAGSIDLDTQALTISGGTLISTSVNPNGGQNIIVSHDVVSRTDNGNQIGLNFGDTFDAETSIQTDQGGHVELVNTTTYTLPANPVPSDNVTGTGTTNTLPIWSDGPNGVLSDSVFTQTVEQPSGNIVGAKIDLPSTAYNGLKIDVSRFTGTTEYFFGENEFSCGTFNFKSKGLDGGFYQNNFRFEGNLGVGRSGDPQNASLDVGVPSNNFPAARFFNGVIISNNPGGIQVDNTSMVIGAGNNDIVNGSDHCLAVGNNNQILNNSDQSVTFGQGNTITDSKDSLAVGNSNTVSSAQRVYALGYNNTIDSASSFVAGGDNNVVGENTNIVLGYSNSTTLAQNFVIGNELTGSGNAMVLGYRNSTSSYPTPNNSLGLGQTKFVVSTGSFTTANSNALLITEGGIQSGGVNQIPRIILPTVPTFSASNDAAADAIGVPAGGLYQNNGVVQVNQGGGSTTDPLASGGGITQTTGTYTPQLIAATPSEWVISSYSIQQGKWVRTGNMVFCDFSITINANNISGNTGGTSGLTIQGWPYDHSGGAGSFQGGALNTCDGFDVQSAGSNVTLNSGLGNAKLNILKQNAAVTNYFVTHNMKTGDLNNGNQIMIIGSFSYLTTDSATLNSGATIDS